MRRQSHVVYMSLLWMAACVLNGCQEVGWQFGVQPYQEVAFIDMRPAKLKALGGYLYITGDTFDIYDITSPLQPQLISTYETSSSSIAHFSIEGERAYIATWEAGWEILDLADPSKLKAQLTWRDPILLGKFRKSIVAADIEVEENIGFLLDGGPYFDGLRIVDLSNLEDIIQLSGIENVELGFSRNDLMAVHDGYVYLVRDADKGPEYHFELLVVDASNPHSPTIVATVPEIGYHYDMEIVGDYLFVVVHAEGVKIFDISTPAKITMIGMYRNRRNNQAIAVNGPYAYLLESFSLKVLDISNIRYPRLIAERKDMANAHDILVYNEHVYVADLFGLFIFDTWKN